MLTLFNRWRGMNTADSPIPVGQTLRKVLCALPFAVVAGLVGLSAGLILAAVAALVVLIVTFAAFTDGHGDQMDLGKSPEDQEKGNHWDKIFGKEGFTAEFLGLTASGLLVSFGLFGALVYFGHYTPAVAFLLVPGLLKAVSYRVAQVTNFKSEALHSSGNDDLGRNNEGGEVLWGASMDIGLLICLILVFIIGL